MKFVIAGALALAAFIALHIPITKKKKGIILAFLALGMILLFAVYNVRTLSRIIRFYHPTDQTVYQKAFLEGGEYTDAFLDEFLKGRTVYTPDDAYEVSDDIDVNADISEDYDEEGNYWLYHYYHAVNMWQYLAFNDAEVVKDASLNSIALSDEQTDAFLDLGSANDMMRYTFVLTPYHGEWGNGFYYYWFYNTYIGDSRVYICPEGLMDAKEIVVLWQKTGTHDTDSYYIASKEYFEKEIIN